MTRFVFAFLRRLSASRSRGGIAKGLLLSAFLLVPVFGLLAEESIAQDLQHSLAARKVLADDPQLEPLQVGVRVQKRIAVVWGPVPTPELAQRIMSLLKKLPELQEVRDELVVDSRSTLPPIAPAALPTVVVWHPLPATKTRPDVLTKFDAKKISDFPTWSPEPPALPRPQVPAAGQPEPGSGLGQQLTALQREDARCRQLRLALQDGNVTVSGRVNRWDDLHAVARLIANLPGVERVVLNQVRIAE